MSYLAQQSLDSIAVFGLDPLMVMGLSVLGSGGVGWLLGPFLGDAVFGVRYRRIAGQMAEVSVSLFVLGSGGWRLMNGAGQKERDLYHRIVKHRVKVSEGGGSSANPVPDYYGEKIDSVQGYRTWMKDQRAFNKKRQLFV